MNEIFFYKIPKILLILIPLVLVSGPFLPDLFLSVIALLGLILLLKNKLIFNHKFFIFYFILFYLIILVSSLLSDNVIHSLDSSFFYFRYLFFTLGAYFIISSNKNIYDKIYYLISIVFIIFILHVYFLLIFKNILNLSYGLDADRISSFFGNELILGSYLSRIFPFYLAMFFYKERSKSEYIITFILFILVSSLIAISGERAAFFYLFMQSFIYFILLDISFKYKLFSLLSIVIIITALFTFNHTYKFRMIDTTINQIQNNNSSFKFFSSHHTQIYNTALKMFADSPIIGHGTKSFRLLCKDLKYKSGLKGCSTHPHNSYLQLLSETGILGFILIISLFLFIFYKFIKIFISKYFLYKYIHKYSNLEICLLTSLFITLWPFIPTGSFFNNWINVIYFMPVPFLLIEYDSK